MLVRQRLPNELGTPLVAGTHGVEVPTGLSQAQPAVRSATDPVGVVIVLAVVLPEAHGADLVEATLGKREVAAAWTPIGSAPGAAAHVDKGFGHGRILAKPRRRRIRICSSGLEDCVRALDLTWRDADLWVLGSFALQAGQMPTRVGTASARP